MVNTHQKQWDYILMVLTVVLLGSLGVQSFLGTIYVWWASANGPQLRGHGYATFVWWMNAIAAPQVIALVIVMGLCVPKRLFNRNGLIAVSAGMAVVGLAAWAGHGQLLVRARRLPGPRRAHPGRRRRAHRSRGARGPSYLTEGRLVKTGSGLLHLGIIVFAIVVVALQGSAFMLPVFWAATALTLAGTGLAFYADKLAWRKRVRIDTERSFAEE
jgi:hypothetical protein